MNRNAHTVSYSATHGASTDVVHGASPHGPTVCSAAASSARRVVGTLCQLVWRLTGAADDDVPRAAPRRAPQLRRFEDTTSSSTAGQHAQPGPAQPPPCGRIVPAAARAGVSRAQVGRLEPSARLRVLRDCASAHDAVASSSAPPSTPTLPPSSAAALFRRREVHRRLQLVRALRAARASRVGSGCAHSALRGRVDVWAQPDRPAPPPSCSAVGRCIAGGPRGRWLPRSAGRCMCPVGAWGGSRSWVAVAGGDGRTGRPSRGGGWRVLRKGDRVRRRAGSAGRVCVWRHGASR